MQDDEFGFEGPHMLCSEGFDTLPRGLAAEYVEKGPSVWATYTTGSDPHSRVLEPPTSLDVRLKCPVKRIEASGRERVTVVMEDGANLQGRWLARHTARLPNATVGMSLPLHFSYFCCNPVAPFLFLLLY